MAAATWSHLSQEVFRSKAQSNTLWLIACHSSIEVPIFGHALLARYAVSMRSYPPRVEGGGHLPGSCQTLVARALQLPLATDQHTYSLLKEGREGGGGMCKDLEDREGSFQVHATRAELICG